MVTRIDARAPHTVPIAERAPVPEGSVDLADFVGEAMLLLGAGSTVLLQLALPGVGHGVADHSTTLQRPLDRLRTTMTYVYAVTLGTSAERKEIVRLVNKAHVPVRAETYNAFDPELQLWVAATLYRNGVTMYERIFGALSDTDAERIYRRSAVYGTALQVKEDMWPRSRAEFDAYWDDIIATVEVDEKVRAFTRNLLSGGDSPLPVRLMMPLQRFMTIGLLPPRIREEFALPWSPRDQRRFDLFWRIFPPVYRKIPRGVRQLSATFYLRDMRRRMASRRRII
ncbi:oxygenase MpaB family protein [Rhodococcus chondri]|uniref:Oxygenase MpaB family protein n=1 Tax=Rhodococcus chondri TaxID=3065941 RepID=A0ABU7JLB3_9NOCA|nr:oxygenase MpaB family protein [Rhodococcus sp. CC-R104]MEE2030828.1 oxygenase MpaB family protein [Rhodococcus sp. CC-R104]